MLLGIGNARARAEDQPVSPATWTDHDGRPIPEPAENEEHLYRTMYRSAIRDPIAHFFDIPDKLIGIAGALGADVEREAVNVNVYD
jgi:hypothetical protein